MSDSSAHKPLGKYKKPGGPLRPFQLFYFAKVKAVSFGTKSNRTSLTLYTKHPLLDSEPLLKGQLAFPNDHGRCLKCSLSTAADCLSGSEFRGQVE